MCSVVTLCRAVHAPARRQARGAAFGQATSIPTACVHGHTQRRPVGVEVSGTATLPAAPGRRCRCPNGCSVVTASPRAGCAGGRGGVRSFVAAFPAAASCCARLGAGLINCVDLGRRPRCAFCFGGVLTGQAEGQVLSGTERDGGSD
jgi:hypothetical protein